MTTVQAIETVYKGYRFRSRLEARWAVYLDAMRVEWVYEPEGWVLADGTHYLIDFWLPDLDMYLEIKPLGMSKSDEHAARRKCMLLAAMLDKTVGCVMGAPYDYQMEIWQLYGRMDIIIGLTLTGRTKILYRQSYDEFLRSYFNYTGVGECYTADGVDVGHALWEVIGNEISIAAAVYFEDMPSGLSFANLEAIMDGATACYKQARFEHGQSPIVQFDERGVPFLEYTSRR